ncbi:UNKNOWN [Stylonychia lemnae]|uniref:Uncharacterized protein n=1 Tax=Stylonychia lemnae TaxID=5949 RepID=A0A078B4B2_STYLE|nr:UNKNOWN [Stylonychia lemnae]|eukprot:CDW88052.1 UNKNOWN [Stylonychia lemnae]
MTHANKSEGYDEISNKEQSLTRLPQIDESYIRDETYGNKGMQNTNTNQVNPLKQYEEFKKKKDMIYHEILQQKSRLDNNHKQLIFNKQSDNSNQKSTRPSNISNKGLFNIIHPKNELESKYQDLTNFNSNRKLHKNRLIGSTLLEPINRSYDFNNEIDQNRSQINAEIRKTRKLTDIASITLYSRNDFSKKSGNSVYIDKLLRKKQNFDKNNVSNINSTQATANDDNSKVYKQQQLNVSMNRQKTIQDENKDKVGSIKMSMYQTYSPHKISQKHIRSIYENQYESNKRSVSKLRKLRGDDTSKDLMNSSKRFKSIQENYPQESQDLQEMQMIKIELKPYPITKNIKLSNLGYSGVSQINNASQDQAINSQVIEITNMASQLYQAKNQKNLNNSVIVIKPTLNAQIYPNLKDKQQNLQEHSTIETLEQNKIRQQFSQRKDTKMTSKTRTSRIDEKDQQDKFNKLMKFDLDTQVNKMDQQINQLRKQLKNSEKYSSCNNIDKSVSPRKVTFQIDPTNNDELFQIRFDECFALEENYMNCLFQKALKDRTMNNNCVLDSILWFHLECPKAASKFDDPITFKRKVHDFIAEQKSIREGINSISTDFNRLKAQFGGVAYPEDVQENKQLRQFHDIFEQHSPIKTPIPEEDYENEHEDDLYEDIDPKEAEYLDIPDFLQPQPITLQDSKRFAPKQEVSQDEE